MATTFYNFQQLYDTEVRAVNSGDFPYLDFGSDQKLFVGSCAYIGESKALEDNHKNLFIETNQSLLPVFQRLVFKDSIALKDSIVPTHNNGYSWKNGALVLFARAESHKLQAKASLEIGDIVIPHGIHPNATITECLNLPDARLPVGIVFSKQGNRCMVLWDINGGAESWSAYECDIMRVRYQFSFEKFDQMWMSWPNSNVWNKKELICKMEEKGNIEEVTTFTTSATSVNKVAKRTKPLQQTVQTTRTCKHYWHYWELINTTLNEGDSIILFNKHVLKVRKHHFEDVTHTDNSKMWWARECAKWLQIDFDNEFMPAATRLGFFDWTGRPAEYLRYQWQYTTMNCATGWALWMLAISDASFGHHLNFGAKWYKHFDGYAIPNGMGSERPGQSGGLFNAEPSKVLQVASGKHPEYVHLEHRHQPRWGTIAQNLIPVFLSVEEAQRAQESFYKGTQTESTSSFSNNSINNNEHIQQQSPSTGPGSEVPETRRIRSQTPKTQAGSGYTGDRRSYRRKTRTVGGSEIPGARYTQRNFRRGSYVEKHLEEEGGDSGVGDGSEQPGGGISGTVRECIGQRNISAAGSKPGPGLDPEGNEVHVYGAVMDEWFTCPECELETVKCTQHHTIHQSGIYDCGHCGHTFSAP